ncbi:MAG: four helix bundle protein [Candidatus Omnitrophica bacterium]|nr:four helix bundle protein [Candidatus Omnitrophota bacterium]
MAKYDHFEQTPAWQEAAHLYNLVLDMFDQHGQQFSSGFRNKLDRAALSVSNNIAEGFDRRTTNELEQFLGTARGSASEVRSMCLVVEARTKLAPARKALRGVLASAESCARQLSGWMASVEAGAVQGKRTSTPQMRRDHEARDAAEEFRQRFLRGLKPDHPLYNTAEARAARGE